MPDLLQLRGTFCTSDNGCVNVGLRWRDTGTRASFAAWCWTCCRPGPCSAHSWPPLSPSISHLARTWRM